MPAANGSLLVAIPTYNERDNIDGLLTSVLALHPRAHIVVVDDGSPDGTGELVGARSTDNVGVVDADVDHAGGTG